MESESEKSYQFPSLINTKYCKSVPQANKGQIAAIFVFICYFGHEQVLYAHRHIATAIGLTIM